MLILLIMCGGTGLLILSLQRLWRRMPGNQPHDWDAGAAAWRARRRAEGRTWT